MTVRHERLRIVVAGMLAGVPFQGGATWAVLQYVLGLRRLGHDVVFVEEVRELGATEKSAVRFFREVASEFDLDGRAALLRSGTIETTGLDYGELRKAASTADLLLNLSGVLRDPVLRDPIPTRVYVDLDPAFTQLWAAQGIDVGLGGHTHDVTVGLDIGQPVCPVPTGGVAWLTTLPPVVLEHWPAADPDEVRVDAFSTVANWRSYGPVVHDGLRLGQKAHSIRELMDLPARAGEALCIALAIDPGEPRDRQALAAHGWRLVDPAAVAGTPDAYRKFVRGSRGELGVAKSGYVDSRCGWFSERSVCYLASGRPVVAQDTGFSRHLPTGRGLLAFETEEEAAEGIARVRSRYAEHARAARSLAEELFDSDRVLAALLEAVA